MTLDTFAINTAKSALYDMRHRCKDPAEIERIDRALTFLAALEQGGAA